VEHDIKVYPDAGHGFMNDHDPWCTERRRVGKNQPMTSSARPVVVGVDGSSEALTAVAWAADEAVRREAPLQVVYANIWPLIRGHWPAAFADQLLVRGEEMVQAAIRHARESAPEAVVNGTVVTGDANPVLVDRSRAAQLVVVGSRGLGGFTGLLVGSTAVALAAHAACPVVVVRTSEGELFPRSGPVVVGVAGSQHDQPADAEVLRFAFEAAARKGTTLTVLHSRTDRSVGDLLSLVGAAPDKTSDTEPIPMLGEARELVEKQLTQLRAKFPEVAVDVLVRLDRPAAALVELSAGAQLVVAGTRGRGGFAGLMLGSVSQALLHHALCPVAIVRPAPGPAAEPS